MDAAYRDFTALVKEMEAKAKDFLNGTCLYPIILITFGFVLMQAGSRWFYGKQINL